MLESGDTQGRDLYLDVSVNGVPAGLIAAFHEDPDGTLAIAPDQLRNVGILPLRSARRPDGLIQINRLPNLRYRYNELEQSIAFTAAEEARAARAIDAAESRAVEERPAARSSWGGVLNYALVASSHNYEVDKRFSLEGASAAFEGRLFSPLGIVSHTFVATASRELLDGVTRLDTTWSYSHPRSMMTYRAGDLITGGLSWTRPTRLGGIQVQRNFALRPDLITFPIPEMAGSAAVPSTVEVYLNNVRRFSTGVPAGPFEIVNLPIVTGAGSARVVVRDVQGQEVATERAFYVSDDLLAPGLVDFSAEIGYPRKEFGLVSSVYDPRLFGSGSLRVGVTDWLALEAHAEGGQDLVNAGAGLAIGAGRSGTVSLFGSRSSSEAGSGYQVGGSVETELAGLHVFGRTQRTFGVYRDIAALASEDEDSEDRLLRPLSGVPISLDQVSVSIPLVFDPSYLNVSYTGLRTFEGRRQRVLGLSYSRRFFERTTLSVSGFKDLDRDTYGVLAGISIPLGADRSASLSGSTRSSAVGTVASISKPQGQQIGDYGWRVRHLRSERAVTSAAASYRLSSTRLDAGIDVQGDRYRATARMEGAIVLAGGGLFASNRIDDAFAIVQAGAPGLEVEYENRRAGYTDRNGKLLIPRLRSYQENRISIDPSPLPLDAIVNNTREMVVPADRSGVVVRFDVDLNADAALVTFRDPAGDPIEMGATGQIGGRSDPFIVGYDGQALVKGLTAHNRITIKRRDGAVCIADLTYAPGQGSQVSIPDAMCQPQ